MRLSYQDINILGTTVFDLRRGMMSPSHLMRQPLIPFYGTMNAEFYTIFPATAHFAAVIGEAR